MMQRDANRESQNEQLISGKPVRITATLSPEQYNALKKISSEKKVSAAWVIRDAIDQLIDKASSSDKVTAH